MFTQIDWNNDIVASSPKPKASSDHHLLSKALEAWMQIEDMCWLSFFITDDPQKKANNLQLMEYFYACFLYQHSLFYKKYQDMVAPDSVDKFDTLEREGLPQGDFSLEELQKIQKSFDILWEEQHEKKNKKWKKVAKKTLKKICEAGIDARMYEEPWKESGDRNEFLINHEGVLYSIYVMKKEDEKERDEHIRDQIKKHQDHVARYFHIDKQVYDFLKTKKQYVCVSAGGGGQMQSFFSDEKGYLGILGYKLRNKEYKPTDKYTLCVEKNGLSVFDEMQVDQVVVNNKWVENFN